MHLIFFRITSRTPSTASTSTSYEFSNSGPWKFTFYVKPYQAALNRFWCNIPKALKELSTHCVSFNLNTLTFYYHIFYSGTLKYSPYRSQSLAANMKPVFEKLEQMKIQVSDLFVDKMKIADMKLLAEM